MRTPARSMGRKHARALRRRDPNGRGQYIKIDEYGNVVGDVSSAAASASTAGLGSARASLDLRRTLHKE